MPLVAVLPNDSKDVFSCMFQAGVKPEQIINGVIIVESDNTDMNLLNRKFNCVCLMTHDVCLQMRNQIKERLFAELDAVRKETRDQEFTIDNLRNELAHVRKKLCVLRKELDRRERISEEQENRNDILRLRLAAHEMAEWNELEKEVYSTRHMCVSPYAKNACKTI